MTKAAILRCIEEMESKLAEVRAAVEKLPEVIEATTTDALADLQQEETTEETNDLEVVFTTLRAAWNIPPDVKPDMAVEELQRAMIEGLPENWASREIIRMREE